MKTITTSNYHGKIKSLLPYNKFQLIEKEINDESNSRLEAFWNIVIAGYPIDFALAKYKKLHEYLKDKPIEYSEALITFETYPGLHSGIYIIKTKWFELN